MIQLVIRAKDGHAETVALFESLYAVDAGEEFEVILVDDGSKKPYDRENVSFEDMTIIQHPRPMGAVTATNSGLAVALQREGDHVVVMDNDCVIKTPGWLKKMKDCFVGKVGCVGATSNRVSGAQHILRVPQTYTGNWEDGKKKGFKQNPAIPTFVSFCCMLSKAALKDVGMWDERYNPGNWEDTDYGLQLREKGWELKVAQTVYVEHQCHTTFKRDYDFQELMVENQRKFLEKWGAGRLYDMKVMSRKDFIEVTL